MLFNASDSGPRNVSSLPASGAALTANTIYNASSPVGTYVFTPPASGWALRVVVYRCHLVAHSLARPRQ